MNLGTVTVSDEAAHGTPTTPGANRYKILEPSELWRGKQIGINGGWGERGCDGQGAREPFAVDRNVIHIDRGDRFVELYTLNQCILLYIKHTSISLTKNKPVEEEKKTE